MHADRSLRRRLVLAAIVALATAGATARPARAQGMGLEELRDMMRWHPTGLIVVDELEYAVGPEGRPVGLEAVGWYGGARNRLWFRVEGEQLTTATDGDAEAHAYYGRLITPFWDALVGARVDGRWGDDTDARGHLALGLVGLAPLRFELSPTAFVSHEGDISFRLRGEYQILVTQRLVVEPDFELNAAWQEAPAWEVSSGLNDLELGLRLHYELRREIAPYLGIAWLRRFGATAGLARERGASASELGAVVGIRMWR